MSQVNSSGVIAGTGAVCGAGGGGGNVTGPGLSTVNDIALFNNTAGSLLSDAGFGFPLANTHLANSTIGIAGTSNQITSSSATPALGGATTIALASPLTFPGKWTGAASTTSAATANIPTGTAPTSGLTSGDLWNLSGILQFYDGTHTNSLTTIQSAPTSLDLAEFSGTAGLLVDSSVAVANIPTQTSNGAANQIATYSGSNKTLIPATTLPAAAEPAHTGDMTNAAGALATTVVKVNGGSLPASKTIVGTNSSSQIVDASSATLTNNTSGNAATATAATTVATTGGSSSSSTFYLPFVASNSSSNQALNTTSGLNFVPSTGVLTAGGLAASGSGGALFSGNLTAGTTVTVPASLAYSVYVGSDSVFRCQLAGGSNCLNFSVIGGQANLSTQVSGTGLSDGCIDTVSAVLGSTGVPAAR